MANIDFSRPQITQLNIQRTTQSNIQASNSSKAIGQGQNVDFKTLLEQQLRRKESETAQVTFSKHAQQRVNDRHIDVSNTALSKLNDAVVKAKEKGVKDALILSGDTMFIVNTISNTVVTALKGSEMKENVFTNIDGTVII